MKDEHCCEWWAKSLQSGTDNEEYSSAISEFPFPGRVAWRIGSIEAAVRFCPWCGAKKNQKSPLHRAAKAVVDARYHGGDDGWDKLNEAIARLEDLVGRGGSGRD